VTQQFLHCPNISSMIEHVRGTGVAQNVWSQTSTQPSSVSIFANNRPRSLAPEAATAGVQKDSICVSASCESFWGEHPSSGFLKPTRQRNTSPTSNRNDAFFRTFAKKSQQSSIEVNVTKTQCTNL
jgi:hypothetical protein